ncbi:hypothetical protein AC1031_019581 [Aphanomyces cochlioides]|nr:hypothetical protein AC1031_019581 [Aphanomyces cochlioides]
MDAAAVRRQISLDSWLGPRDPRSYRRLFVYFVLNWLFSISIWLYVALSLVVSVAFGALLYLFRGPLRRRRLAYKAMACLWNQEVFLANLVLPARISMMKISHWDVTRESIYLSAIYFVVWKACLGFLVFSLPLLYFAIDSTSLRILNIDVDVLISTMNVHPIVLRLAFVAYFLICLWACEIKLAFMVHVSASTYSHVFEACVLFRESLQSNFPAEPLQPPIGGDQPTADVLTTYSRVTSGRTAIADTRSPMVIYTKSPMPSTQIESPEQEDHIAIDLVPSKKALQPAVRVKAVYDRMSPPPSPQYSMLTPPIAPGVSRAVPVAVEDAHFAMYGPPCVGTEAFSLHLWAFSAQQRETMDEIARETSNHSAISRENLLKQVAHGSLVHATLEVPQGFDLLTETPTQSMTWTGDIESLSFALQRASDAEITGHVLFKCTLVVGAKVLTMRTFVLVAPEAANEDVHLLESSFEELDKSYQEIPYTSLQIHEWIGSGAGGDAYRATYEGEEVVVKTIRASEFGTSGDVIQQAFQHEAAVLNRFGHHPNMVPFVGACTDPSFPLGIVTTYMQHGSLETHCQEKSLSIMEKELILADVAAATWTIHDSGFVHRDLAARNCLVDANHRGVLSDFGMCRQVGAVGGGFVHHGSSGPLKYMAPETLAPPHGFTAKSDVYAFGVLVWETLFETKPFANLTPLQAAVRVLEGDRLPLVDLDERYKTLLSACFQENPTHRPTMQHIYHTLRSRDASVPRWDTERFEATNISRRTRRELSG